MTPLVGYLFGGRHTFSIQSSIFKFCAEIPFHLPQELLVYLSMFVKTEPTLFNEMLRLRVGLIMEVMAAEFARATALTGKCSEA